MPPLITASAATIAIRVNTVDGVMPPIIGRAKPGLLPTSVRCTRRGPGESAEITSYDEAHLVTYLRLLDASAAGISEEEMCRVILGLDPAKEPERACSALKSHLARAHWMTSKDYRHLLMGAAN
jgi:hypothetical protein